MTGSRDRLLLAVLAGFAVVGLTAGCTPAPVEAPAELESEAEVRAPDEVTAAGVVLAALLLSTSDITAAVAEGLVTPAEVDAALAAIEDGTLDEWRLKAEHESAD